MMNFISFLFFVQTNHKTISSIRLHVTEKLIEDKLFREKTGLATERFFTSAVSPCDGKPQFFWLCALLAKGVTKQNVCLMDRM